MSPLLLFFSFPILHDTHTVHVLAMSSIQEPPLFQLPIELRQLIYEKVTGSHKYLHIRLYHHGNWSPLGSRVCVQHPPEAHGQSFHTSDMTAAQAGDLKKNMPVCVYRHQKCMGNGFNMNFFRALPNVLPLLLTSHCIHAEASNLIYSTSIFSFDRPIPLERFQAVLLPEARWALRSLHLSLKSVCFTNRERGSLGYNAVLSALAMLYGLKNLQLCIDVFRCIDPDLAKGVHQIIKVTKAVVTVCLSGHEDIRNPNWECGNWSVDKQDCFGDEVWCKIMTPGRLIKDGRYSGSGRAKQGKYILWAPIERQGLTII